MADLQRRVDGQKNDAMTELGLLFHPHTLLFSLLLTPSRLIAYA
jgi:hypothetical protein